MKPAISVRKISKCYKLGVINRHTLVDEVRYWWSKVRGRDPKENFTKVGHTATEARRINAEKAGNDRFWALKDISFDVQPGEVLGIIGKNGAGKSTLLKILTRITEPTSGEAIINGRVGSLLEVGTGFHPELTGRENVYMNGAILGMKKREIDAKFDEIVAFSELEKFIDTPVKRYSSGMYVRLAFAVAAHLEPEILLIDEVLAVGDAEFQKKCLGKMGDVAKEGRTILFVSHNMGAITELCHRCIWLQDGCIRLDGNNLHVVSKYVSGNSTNCSGQWKRPPFRSEEDTFGDKELIIISAHIISISGDITPVINFDDQFMIEVRYLVKKSIRNISITLRVIDAYGRVIFSVRNNDAFSLAEKVRCHGMYYSRCVVPEKLLRPGRYYMTVISHVHRVKIIEYLDEIVSFEISPLGFPVELERPGILYPQMEWKTERLDS